MAITHPDVATGADDPDAEINKAEWNASHTVADGSFAAAKLAASATDRVFGRSTAGAGNGEEIPLTAAGRALIDDADAAAQRTTLGLVPGTNVPTQAAFDDHSARHDAGGADALAIDAAAATGSLRTLGTGATQAAAGNHGHSASTIGAELDYVQITSPVTISATVEASATNIVTGSSVVYDGSTTIIIECFFNYLQVPVADHCVLWLFDDTAGVSLGNFAQVTNPDATNPLRVAVHPARRLTPVAGARVYSIRGTRVTANAVANAGAGGVAAHVPGFIRITRVN